MSRPRALAPPGAGRVLVRALRLRCPRCGQGRLWARAFTMHEACAACGMRYEREPGYFVGAIYVNYAVTVALALGGVLALDLAVGLSLRAQLVLAVAVAALVPVAFFRYARSLWLAIDYLVSRADERSARRRTR
ncbi:MAG TPA: DUF983 domain-containing protein [Candidatus Binatia bacterium]|nr:DUF983 domain-containing protein [Candidatus Binatia bacterium]